MGSGTLAVALISDVFPDPSHDKRLLVRLREARAQGAELALLPELPLDPWVAATDEARDKDAEAAGGPRHGRLGTAARSADIAVVGGAIVRDAATGRRHNTALVVDASGSLIASYRKAHLPEEPGFWETSHYAPGDAAPTVIDSLGLTFGVQICSDVNRPTGTLVLGGLGAEAVLAPRATEQRTYQRWRVVFQANALTSAMYVLSVNRPAPERDVLIGGPSIAVAPDGEVLVETTDPVAVVTLERERVRHARRAYPGYLPVRARMYADAWAAVASRDG
jgi:predicted amidohydrolase